jgi:hypothetical protein
MTIHFREESTKKAFILRFLSSSLPEEEFKNKTHKSLVLGIMKSVPGFHPDFGNTIMMAIGLKKIFKVDQETILTLVKNRTIADDLVQRIFEDGFIQDLVDSGEASIVPVDLDPSDPIH